MKKILLLLFVFVFVTQHLVAQTDTIPPTLVCKDIPWVSVGPLCFTSLLVSELVDTVYDDSPYYELAVRKRCTGSGFPASNFVSLDASEQGLQSLEVWARDSSGNTTSCVINLGVFDMNGFCDPASSLRYETPKHEGIQSVFTRVKGNNCQLDTIDYTIPSNQGWGIFWSSWNVGSWMTYGGFVPSAGYNYDLKPSRNYDPLNGVTTYDLSLISKHILGISSIDSPYNLISADVNQDGKVTTFDIVILRKLILGIINELPNGKSWRFIPADYVFPNPANPFDPPFPEKITVPNTYDYPTGGYKFWGVKIGDVNFTADPN